MGRLVDADSLIYKLDKRRTYESEIRNKAYGKGVRDAMKDIDNAPTIDAIPVEWLLGFDLYYSGISGGSPYLKDLIEAWQKEQEAMKNGH